MSPSELLGVRYVINDYQYFESNPFFSEQQVSTVSLKHSVNDVGNRYAVMRALFFHLWAQALLHKDPRISGIVNEYWLQLKVTKRVSLPFEALKSGTDFSSLPMKVLDDIFFQYKAVLSKLKTCCIV